MQWTEKHKPKRLDEFAGSKALIDKVRSWFLDGYKKPLLLRGVEGTGKTSLVYALAEEYGFDVLHINASDSRSSKTLKTLETSIETFSVHENLPRIILFDEVDGLHNRADRGGSKVIIAFIKDSTVPIVLIENEYDYKNKSLYDKCHLIKVKKLNRHSIKNLLVDIAEKEGYYLSRQDAMSIALNANGSARSAINDLQQYLITEDMSFLDRRDQSFSVFDLITSVFSETDYDPQRMIDTIVMRNKHRMIMLWMHENAWKFALSSEELAEFYSLITETDKLVGAVGFQNWRLLRYIFYNMTMGLKALKVSKYRYSNSDYPRMRFISKEAKERKEVLKKLGRVLYCSSEKLAPYFEHICLIFAEDVHASAITSIEADLTEEEVILLGGRQEILQEIGELKPKLERRKGKARDLDMNSISDWWQ
jgi:replication factor C large subunit